MTYKIVRFRMKAGTKRGIARGLIIARGLTLEEAQKHCQDPKTKGKDWFDGYTRED